MDVRDTLRNMLNADYTLEDSVAQIVADFGLNDVDEASVDGLLALADCLWKYGSLPDDHVALLDWHGAGLDELTKLVKHELPMVLYDCSKGDPEQNGQSRQTWSDNAHAGSNTSACRYERKTQKIQYFAQPLDERR